MTASGFTQMILNNGYVPGFKRLTLLRDMVDIRVV